MTDETPEPDPRTDEVRRLLAEARHDEPMPADVAARMDRVLADLSTTSATPVVTDLSRERAVSGATVTELPLHRRRRAGALLAAAAAIVVGGVVFAQHLPHGGSAAQESATAGGERFSASDSAGDSAASPPSPSAAASSAAVPRLKPVLFGGRVVVRSNGFPEDALAGRTLLARETSRQLTPAKPPCPTSSAGQQVVAALYRSAPAALVYHAPDGSTQVVDLVVCGSRRPIRSVTLPAP